MPLGLRETMQMIDESYRFYDTIDLIEFIPSGVEIDLDDLINIIEDYFDNKHPELLPQKFQGCFFCFINREEFATYLEKRYGFHVKVELIEKYYLCGRPFSKEEQKKYSESIDKLYKPTGLMNDALDCIVEKGD